jgi:hypothetical protein
MRYVLWAAVAYEAAIGVSEMFWVTLGNAQMASVAAWPSVSSVVDPAIGTSSNANYVEGGIDLGVAAAIWFFFLRG